MVGRLVRVEDTAARLRELVGQPADGLSGSILVATEGINGMLAGIGVLIIASQIHVMFDARPLPTGFQNFFAAPILVFNAITMGAGAQAALLGHALPFGLVDAPFAAAGPVALAGIFNTVQCQKPLPVGASGS